MQNDSLTILKLFTRKLANCRYKVSTEALVKFMSSGRFGYTVDKETSQVITNDFVFADDVATLVAHIRSIFKEPHIFLKKEEVVQNVAIANKFDSKSLGETFKDDKIWCIKNGAAAPEFVHAYVYEDNLAIYENRFVSYLIDMIIEEITLKINTLMQEIATLNKMMGAEDNKCFAPIDYVDYVDFYNGEIPVIVSADSVTANIVNSLIKSKKTLIGLQKRELYIACKKAGPFNVTNLKATNIFLNDKDYFFCYNFYLNYLNKEPIFTTESKMYYGFTTVHLINAIVKAGFVIDEDAEDISVSNSAHLRFESIKFNNDIFNIELSQEGEYGVMMTVTNLVDINVGKFLFTSIDNSLTCTLDDFKSVGQYIEKLTEEKPEGVVRTTLITDIEDTGIANTLYITPNAANVEEMFLKLVKSCTLLVEGSEFLHSRYCPVCGSKLVAPDNDDYICVTCNSQYHIFQYSARDLIWIKNLPVVADEDRAKTEQEIIVEEEIVEQPATEIAQEAVEEVSAEDAEWAYVTGTEKVEEPAPVEEKEVTYGLKKSFLAKLAQSENENQAYYAEIKNYLLNFKKVNSRVSWNYDSFTMGREALAKVTIRGKTLVLFLALDPEQFVDTKYYPHDKGDVKKFEDTPMMVKVKSERGLKFAKELIDMMLEGVEHKKEFTPGYYEVPYMSDKELVDAGYAKIVERNI